MDCSEQRLASGKWKGRPVIINRKHYIQKQGCGHALPEGAMEGSQRFYSEWESPCRRGDAGNRGPHCAKAVEGLRLLENWVWFRAAGPWWPAGVGE